MQIPLAAILATLPDWLSSRVQQRPAAGTSITIPLTSVLSQLGHGAVRITFGELRSASPRGVFSDASDQDQAAVQLPLHEILSQLPAEQLPKRTGQKRIEIPDDVVPLFGPKGEPLTRVTRASAPGRQQPGSFTPAAPSAPGSSSQESPSGGGSVVYPSLAKLLQATPPSPSLPGGARGAVPGPVAPQGAPTLIKSTVPLPLPTSPKVSPIGVTAPTSHSPAPSVAPNRTATSAPGIPVSAQSPAAPSIAMPRVPAPAPVSRPASPPQAAPAQHAGGAPSAGVPLRLPLRDVVGSLPEPIRTSLQTGAASDAHLVLPGSEVEEALKRGKIAFSWDRLATLVEPPFQGAVDPASAGVSVELPLAVVAPLFLATRRPVAPQRKVTITEAIPDVFQARQGSAPAASVAVSSPGTAAASAPAVAAAPAVVTTAQASSAVPREIGEVFGQPGRKNWTPMELVQRTATLPGIAGALIAMQDGLLVANQMPTGLNGETIAAFIPQMYSRIMQYCKELKFSEADSFAFIVDGVPMKIFKVGGVYFTVLGRSGEPLPDSHLGIIASHLAPQNK